MLSDKESRAINKAIRILEGKLLVSTLTATSSDITRQYCQLQLASCTRENFGVLFLDNQHNLIEFNIMFQGTINAAAVYPREVAKLALELNAAAVILTHNHPSGILEASLADKAITERIRKGLDMLDIRLLDHIIVSLGGTFSFSEQGML